MITPQSHRLGLEAAVEAWDREAAKEILERAAGERERFIERFPPAIWPDLPLERYALGVPESSENFSRWLEFETPSVGSVKGGSARKHLVYKHQKKPGWYFQNNKYSSEHEAWDVIRHGFAELVRLGAQGRWSEIDEIDALWEGSAVRSKTAWMYFPDRLLPVYSERHIDFFIRIFGLDIEDKGTVYKNRQLFEALTDLDVFRGWPPVEIMCFLYDWADPAPSHQILKVAPGENARLWDDCLANGYIRVGWDDLGDLTLLANVEEIQEALSASYDTSKMSLSKSARGLERLRSLEDGDIVVANRGSSTVIGIGTVNGGYRYRDDLADHRHTVAVDWFDVTERRVDFGAAWRAPIVPVKAHQYHALVRGAENGMRAQLLPVPPVPEMHLQGEKLLKRTGQLILYGPPGTGKTYSARRHAAWLLAGGSDSPEAANAFGTHEQLSELETAFSVAEGRARRATWVAVTNPQHWRWTDLPSGGAVDFSHGRIEANFDTVRPGDTVYGYEATPTKAIVAHAQISRGLHASADGARRILIDSGRMLDTPLSWAEMQEDAVLSKSEPVQHGMQGTVFKLNPAEAERLAQLVGVGGEPEAELPAAPLLTRLTFHPTYTYEDFIEGYKPTESGHGLELRMRDGIFKQVCRSATVNSERLYVLVIDEINRGNVPKIFGELITLIEADKRGMTVTLPQSGEPFMVPPNVYLIGTMNTADRSVHVLDAALRRRFAFLELLPDPTVLEGASVGTLPLDELLRELNGRVREQIGREKQLGHALLMNGDAPIATTDDFALAFRYEILPLLQEYTYGDYADLVELLGPEVIDVDNQLPRTDVLDSPTQLISALAAHLEIAPP